MQNHKPVREQMEDTRSVVCILLTAAATWLANHDGADVRDEHGLPGDAHNANGPPTHGNAIKIVE